MALAAWLGSAAHAQEALRREYAVKAAFLLNFARFVRWPDAFFGDADAPLAICLVGPDPFGDLLERAVEEKSVRGRRVVVRRDPLLTHAAPGACAIVFVGRPEPVPLEPLLGNAARIQALTVGDAPGFADRGGMIGFVLREGRVRFEVNLPAARAPGLEVSAQLVKVAHRVIE